MHESKRESLPPDLYAELQAVANEAGSSLIVLPGGGHKKLEEYLTCNRCGRFVCYRHNPGIKPMYQENGISIPSPEGNVWSRPVPERIIQKFTDDVLVGETVDK